MNAGISGLSAAGRALAVLIEEIVQTDGEYAPPLTGLMLYRCSRATEPMPCIYSLGLGLAVQGGKRVTLGNEIFDYGPAQSLVTSVDLPVVSYVTHATPAEPYLGLRLELDARMVAEVANRMDFPSQVKTTPVRAISVVTLDEGLLDALIRLLRLLDQPRLIAHLAPLIQQELAVRLLSGEHGPTLRHRLAAGSPSQQIAKVMTWLKLHYGEYCDG